MRGLFYPQVLVLIKTVITSKKAPKKAQPVIFHIMWRGFLHIMWRKAFHDMVLGEKSHDEDG
jgi:hypothetical protein